MVNIKVFTFNPFQENTYVLYNETGQALLIDPGCYFPGELDMLEKFITEKKLRVEQLVNTHCHLDHIFGNQAVSQKWALPLQIHSWEKVVLSHGGATAAMYNLELDDFTGQLHFLAEGDTIHLGEDSFTVLLAPGHSPGSICLYCAAQHFVIGGDVLFRDSIGRTDLPGGDHQQLLENIREKLFTLPEDTIVYPGHGPETTIGYEKKNNPFLQV